MKAFTKGPLGAMLLIGLALAGLYLGMSKAHAQDRPITKPIAEWFGVVTNVSFGDKRGCVAGWTKADDKYGEPSLQTAFFDGARADADTQQLVSDGISSGSMAMLAAVPHIPVGTVVNGQWRWDPVLQPCIDKLTAPPPVWVVAPSASGARPAYLVNPDGTRGRQKGTAAVMLDAANPMWCNCSRVHVVTPTSTMCPWATQKETFDPLEPVRVTLCKAFK